MFKNLKKITSTLVSDFYKIELFRTIICILRFIYFFYLRKKINFYLDPKQKVEDHVLIENSSSKFSEKRDNKHTVIGHNMHFVDNFFNLRKTYKTFSGKKTAELGYPLKSIDFLDYDNDKVLSVGPRNEGELYFIRSLGFKWKNIEGLDLISYSDRIKLGDIHDSDYPDNKFNIIICGWVLAYSNNFKKILNEILRISKNGALISIGFTYYPDQKNNLYSTDQIIEIYKDKISNIYFQYDAFKKKDVTKRHSIIILRIKK